MTTLEFADSGEEAKMKKSLAALAMTGILCIVATMLVSCPGFLSGEAEIAFKARLVGSASSSRTASVETDVNLTPGNYKIAMTYFSLFQDDGTEVVLIDATDADPEIIDFSGSAPGTLISLFDDRSIAKGTYAGYAMRFLYLEMSYEAAFHVPSISTDAADPYIDEAAPTEKTFRQYFNANGPFWKRDFIVLKPDGASPPEDAWYWMRREVDATHLDFFIDSSTAHPSGGAGPDNTLDLFANDEFWGAEADYDDPDVRITIESGDTTGGLNAVMDEFTLRLGTTLLLEIDVSDSMNFKEDIPALPPAGVTFNDGIMDLGPAHGADLYGDRGFHPFLPVIRVRELDS